MQKAIATAPGEPTLHLDMTDAEIQALQASQASKPVFAAPQQIDFLVSQLTDITAYPRGIFGDMDSLISKGAWNLALQVFNTVTPTTQDQTTYNSIKSIIQAQIPV